MEMTWEQRSDGVCMIALNGRLDIAGAQAIDVKFTALTATKTQQIVVEVSQVSFLASIGIRTLVSNAKAQARRGGKMVLAGPQPAVHEVLQLAGIDTLIPVYPDTNTACESLRTAGTA